jgi:hypothetical protein
MPGKGPDSQEEFDRRLTAIEQRLKKAIIGKVLVNYSAYPTDDDDLPLDNLDEVAVEGRCRFVQQLDPEWGDGKHYMGPEVENPTWITVAILANEMIAVTGDHQHVFLEGVTILSEQSGVKIMEFVMGS